MAYAASYGAIGHRVTSVEEFVPTLQAAFAAGGVHLVAVPIDYSENSRVLIDELGGPRPHRRLHNAMMRHVAVCSECAADSCVCVRRGGGTSSTPGIGSATPGASANFAINLPTPTRRRPRARRHRRHPHRVPRRRHHRARGRLHRRRPPRARPARSRATTRSF